jgi:hypothetical protein
MSPASRTQQDRGSAWEWTRSNCLVKRSERRYQFLLGLSSWSFAALGSDSNLRVALRLEDDAFVWAMDAPPGP